MAKFEDWLTIRHAAEELGVSVTCVNSRYVATGLLETAEIYGRRMVSRKSLEEFRKIDGPVDSLGRMRRVGVKKARRRKRE